jgi:hypothetical protein
MVKVKIKFKIKKYSNAISIETGTHIPLFYDSKLNLHVIGTDGGDVYIRVDDKETPKLLRKISKLHYCVKDIYETP